MAIDCEKLMALPIPEVEQTYTERDTMLYALAVGMGSDPTDARALRFVFERDLGRSDNVSPGLSVVPTMATVLAWNDDWMYRTGIDMVQQVHGEERIRIVHPIPPAATVVARTRVVEVFDKGPGRGAIVIFETEVREKTSGRVLAVHRATSFARGDGGFGGPRGSGPAPHPIPARAADVVVDLATQPNQALYYRLCGDRNPLHADPEYAKAGGFPRPILHGLCTLGHACAAVLRGACDFEAERIREIETRFTAPVFPGETIRTELWCESPVGTAGAAVGTAGANVVSFRSRAVERDVVVLDHGKVVLA
jgi:acyl dehydratase